MRVCIKDVDKFSAVLSLCSKRYEGSGNTDFSKEVKLVRQLLFDSVDFCIDLITVEEV